MNTIWMLEVFVEDPHHQIGDREAIRLYNGKPNIEETQKVLQEVYQPMTWDYLIEKEHIRDLEALNFQGKTKIGDYYMRLCEREVVESITHHLEANDS